MKFASAPESTSVHAIDHPASVSIHVFITNNCLSHSLVVCIPNAAAAPTIGIVGFLLVELGCTFQGVTSNNHLQHDPSYDSLPL
ncbi:hypothetical protein I7I48_08221 [Histoplasma ohiense]|nr:hypothetical protein I7I48_08221 [Histoplasma ohiense (nom. inval.)]